MYNPETPDTLRDPITGADALKELGVDLDALTPLMTALHEAVWGEDGETDGDGLRIDYRMPASTVGTDGDEHLATCELTGDVFPTSGGQVPIVVYDAYDSKGHAGVASHVVCWRLEQDRSALLEALAEHVWEEYRAALCQLGCAFDALLAVQKADDVPNGSLHEQGRVLNSFA